MKNITVSVDDETYRRARIKAAEQDTSVSALVRRFLSDLGASESEFERLKRLEQEVRARLAELAPDAVTPDCVTRLADALLDPATVGKEWAATVLGMLGVVSLGYWIQDARSKHYYDEMLFFVALGALIVLAGDLVSALSRAALRRPH